MPNISSISGITPQNAPLWLRGLYKVATGQIKKLTGKADLAESLQITAHQPRLLAAVSVMELAQQGMRSPKPASMPRRQSGKPCCSNLCKPA
jgi:hypothetical protein